MNSSACSSDIGRGGISFSNESALDRTFVSFFSFVGLTSMSSARAFSPTIMPSYTVSPGPTNSCPRSCSDISE